MESRQCACCRPSDMIKCCAWQNYLHDPTASAKPAVPLQCRHNMRLVVPTCSGTPVKQLEVQAAVVMQSCIC